MQVSTECVSVYNELRLSRKYRYIIYSLNSDNTEIVVEKTGPTTATYDEFVGDLPENECRWAVYDFDFEKDDGGKRTKITFFSW